MALLDIAFIKRVERQAQLLNGQAEVFVAHQYAFLAAIGAKTLGMQAGGLACLAILAVWPVQQSAAATKTVAA